MYGEEDASHIVDTYKTLQSIQHPNSEQSTDFAPQRNLKQLAEQLGISYVALLKRIQKYNEKHSDEPIVVEPAPWDGRARTMNSEDVAKLFDTSLVKSADLAAFAEGFGLNAENFRSLIRRLSDQGIITPHKDATDRRAYAFSAKDAETIKNIISHQN